MAFILTVLAVFAMLCISEIGWRKQWFANELGRKFVHITVGSFVAFWPFFLSWTEIRLLSVAFLVVVLLSQYFHVFRAIHSVQRPTYGEVFFALTVGLLTYVTHSKGVYAAAILQMSLADGLAAVVGTRFGRENKYHFLGHTKSVVGTLTFAAVSLLLLTGFSLWGPTHLPVMVIAFGAFVAAGLENVGVFGIDNILVPLFIAFLLTNM